MSTQVEDEVLAEESPEDVQKRKIDDPLLVIPATPPEECISSPELYSSSSSEEQVSSNLH